MSAVKIRAALESGLNGISPALLTAWENHAFTPPATSTPYQIAHVLLARPNNAVFGSEHQELGYMHVRLMYPPQIGTATVAARAELIRTTFRRGATFSNGGVNVVIIETPEIMPGANEDGRYAQVVKVRFFANINY